MIINIMTLFPELYREFLTTSILGRAIKNSIIHINIYNIRDFSLNKHKKVDDYVYGGGNGMLMMCQPVVDCYRSFAIEGANTYYMSPKGKILDDKLSRDISKEKNINILCGHYEGIDERALNILNVKHISIGDYILTGGELASMVLIDTVIRHIEGVLTNEESHDTESFQNNLLECPQWTRPYEYEGLKVPDILLNGDHKKVQDYNLEQSIKETKKYRPDLYEKYMTLKKGENHE